VKVLHKTRDTTLGQCAFISVNFCAKKPPVNIKFMISFIRLSLKNKYLAYAF